MVFLNLPLKFSREKRKGLLLFHFRHGLVLFIAQSTKFTISINRENHSIGGFILELQAQASNCYSDPQLYGNLRNLLVASRNKLGLKQELLLLPHQTFMHLSNVCRQYQDTKVVTSSERDLFQIKSIRLSECSQKCKLQTIVVLIRLNQRCQLFLKFRTRNNLINILPMVSCTLNFPVHVDQQNIFLVVVLIT